eukprot:scaffold46696_cov65-Phaeocystis_antarctica.AAC.3
MTVRGPPTTSAAHAALSLPRAQQDGRPVGHTPGLRSDTLTTATARLGLAEPRRRLESRRHRHAALPVGQPYANLWRREVRAGGRATWRGGDVVLAPLLREAAQVPPSEIALGDRLGQRATQVEPPWQWIGRGGADAWDSRRRDPAPKERGLRRASWPRSCSFRHRRNASGRGCAGGIASGRV